MNKLMNTDSIEVMRNMIENGEKVDLVVTDPPYKITSRGNTGNTGGMLKGKQSMSGKIFNHNNISIREMMECFYGILKEQTHCYVMCNDKNLQEMINEATNAGFSFVKLMTWNKGNKIMGRFYMNQTEHIIFLRKGKAKQINNCGTSNLFDIPNKKTKGEDGKNLHDTEKPVELMKILIENSSQPGETVIDPFMGIGSTGIAANRLGRKFIGIELDEQYFNIAKKRIEDDNNE